MYRCDRVSRFPTQEIEQCFIRSGRLRPAEYGEQGEFGRIFIDIAYLQTVKIFDFSGLPATAGTDLIRARFAGVSI